MALSPLRDGDPRQVGGYALQARIGSGAMGTVFLGVGPRGERAVKVVRLELVADPDARARFAREIAVARRVRSTRVARLVDADPDAALPWFASEYVEGPDLEEAVRARGPLRVDQLRELAAALAAALADLHGAGVLHRDLKPGNVVLGWDGPRVVDLGVARDELAESTSLTRVGVNVGSPAWMSPEQLLGDHVGPAADVHAWGAVLVFAASGAGPYPGPTTAAFAYQVVNAAPALPGLPRDLAGLVAAALDKDPARRPSAGDLVRLLGAPRATAPAGLSPPPDSPQQVWPSSGTPPVGGTGVRRPRRSGLLVGGTVLTAVVVSGGVGATVVLAGGGTPPAPVPVRTATPLVSRSAGGSGSGTAGPVTPRPASTVGTPASKELCSRVNPSRASELLGTPIEGAEAGDSTTLEASCTWLTQDATLASPLVYTTTEGADATSFAAQRGVDSGAQDVPGVGQAAYLTTSETTLRLSVLTDSGVQLVGSFDADLPDAKAHAIAFVTEVVGKTPPG